MNLPATITADWMRENRLTCGVAATTFAALQVGGVVPLTRANLARAADLLPLPADLSRLGIALAGTVADRAAWDGAWRGMAFDKARYVGVVWKAMKTKERT
jgi:hypothetical protein